MSATSPDGALRKYEIKTLNDFIYVPARRRAACLRDFEQALKELDLSAILSDNPDATRKTPIVFTWVDDGSDDDSVRLDMARTNL